jgi:photosystem II stability/assembly factor-like uncharacterized protein
MARAAVAALSLLAAGAAAASGPAAYRWRHVRVGGGGYVSGVVFHPHERGLYYARTDIGGAYRWDEPKRRWMPLTDWIDADHANLMGIQSIALDPADADRVYLAAGTYTTERAGNAALLRSTDRGAHFERTDLPFKLGANQLGRGNGERLAVDPHAGHVLLLGTPAAGLWRSDDHGAHWRHVDGFPAVATAPEASAENGGQRQPVGIAFVVFDAASGRAGAPTPTVYAGVSTRGTSLFRSDDGGVHWQAVAGQPTGLRPTHMRAAGPDRWLLVYDDEPGPDITHDGAIRAFEPARGRWTDITPLPRGNGPAGYGWGDVGVDPQHPQHLTASTFGHYQPHDLLFRSVDGGAHWREVFAHSQFERDNAVWTREHVPHWMSTVAVDPFDPDRVLFVTGYGIWASRDMRAFDRGGTVHWWFQNDGLEETVPLALISPPAGAPLLSAMGDLDGYRHDDLSRAPLQFAAPPRYANGESIDFAASAPAIVVRSGIVRDGKPRVRAAYSRDGGRHWQAFASEPPAGEGAGDIAIAADAATVVWSPRRAAATYVTRDFGAHWTARRGLPPAVQVFADRVDPQRFYAYAAASGQLFASRDGGLHFAPVGGAFGQALAEAAGAPAQARAVPGVRGGLYVANRRLGLLHGDAEGRLIGRDAAIDSAEAVGFGKAASVADGPTLFVAGTLHGQRGLYRSTDGGTHWRRINDDAHQYGHILDVVGDPRVFGRVYVATEGRGIVYGEPATAEPETRR